MTANFTDTFDETMKDIRSRAEKCGLSINELCKRAGLARATPDRWSKNTPNTVELVTKLQEAVDIEEQALARRTAEAAATETPPAGDAPAGSPAGSEPAADAAPAPAADPAPPAA